MVNKKHLNIGILLIAFFILTAAMISAGLYPFDFSPPNRVKWVQNEPGLYFDGAGIAYTKRGKSISIKGAVTVELLLKERRGSRNWGPKEIFSFYDGVASPPLLVGQWDGRIFIYSRFEKNKGRKWYRLFRTKQRFPKGKSHLITVTFNEREKAIYIDGKLSDRRNVELISGMHIQISGSFLIGNSPLGNYGWRGEIKGLAVYSRILLPDEIMKHSKKIFQKGMSGVAEISDCLVLYPFGEGRGNTTKSILNKANPFFIPLSLNALQMTIFSLPSNDMRFLGYSKIDFIKNIIFFIPFGILLSVMIFKKYTTNYFTIFLMVTLAGGLLSCLIEGFQLYIPERISGIADIFGNMLGSVFGTLVTYIILKEKS